MVTWGGGGVLGGGGVGGGGGGGGGVGGWGEGLRGFVVVFDAKERSSSLLLLKGSEVRPISAKEPNPRSPGTTYSGRMPREIFLSGKEEPILFPKRKRRKLRGEQKPSGEEPGRISPWGTRKAEKRFSSKEGEEQR